MMDAPNSFCRITLLALLCSLLALPLAAEGRDAPKAWRAQEIFLRDDAEIERLLQAMSVEEKAGQMIVAVIDAQCGATRESAITKMEELLGKGMAGGVMFLKGDTDCARRLAARFQAAAPLPLLLSADMERGLAMRLEGATRFPTAMALAATGEPKLARDMGQAIALEARSCGLHQNYAPTVDLNSNPDNPVINTRSLGDRPAPVIRMADAMIEGLQTNGLIATAKHFPGHGDVEVDSHLALPVLQADRQRLEEYELQPFKAAIRTGVMSVMVGHLAVPKLTGNREPASISPAIVTGLLRREFGFQGLIVTDALNMKALYNGKNEEETAVKALEAGNDLLLFPPDPERAHQSIVKAVRSGRIDEHRLDDSVKRILQAKRWLGLDIGRAEERHRQEALCGSNAHRQLADTIAARSATLLREQRGDLPLKRAPEEQPPLVITLEGESTGGSRLSGLGPATHLRLGLQPAPQQLAETLALAKKASAVLIISRATTVSTGRTPRPSTAQRSFVRELGAALPEEKPVVLLAFGTPYIAALFPEIGTVLCTWGAGTAAEAAALRIVTGQEKALGNAPVAIPTINH